MVVRWLFVTVDWFGAHSLVSDLSLRHVLGHVFGLVGNLGPVVSLGNVLRSVQSAVNSLVVVLGLVDWLVLSFGLVLGHILSGSDVLGLVFSLVHRVVLGDVIYFGYFDHFSDVFGDVLSDVLGDVLSVVDGFVDSLGNHLCFVNLFIKWHLIGNKKKSYYAKTSKK